MGPVSLPTLKKAYKKVPGGISWGPILILGPQAVPECLNGQSAPGNRKCPKGTHCIQNYKSYSQIIKNFNHQKF
ncbi:unnamed protein product [Staurois parvus]|uniref:Uncharacterized protein n=1 Tax=Staurois parvus TaxID=386267 RepID=A0ABN9B8I4_9NEOB|nr:unnamed protein product [Staurois parvus]